MNKQLRSNGTATNPVIRFNGVKPGKPDTTFCNQCISNVFVENSSDIIKLNKLFSNIEQGIATEDDLDAALSTCLLEYEWNVWEKCQNGYENSAYAVELVNALGTIKSCYDLRLVSKYVQSILKPHSEIQVSFMKHGIPPLVEHATFAHTGCRIRLKFNASVDFMALWIECVTFVTNSNIGDSESAVNNLMEHIHGISLMDNTKEKVVHCWLADINQIQTDNIVECIKQYFFKALGENSFTTLSVDPVQRTTHTSNNRYKPRKFM